MPKVSIDGEPHGELLLMAIGSGVTAAFVIIMILISLIRYKNDSQIQSETKNEPKFRQHGEFVMTPASLESNISEASTNKSNLMFRFFGKSLSSLDPERREVPNDLNKVSDHHLYKQNIFIISDIGYHLEQEDKLYKF